MKHQWEKMRRYLRGSTPRRLLLVTTLALVSLTTCMENDQDLPPLEGTWGLSDTRILTSSPNFATINARELIETPYRIVLLDQDRGQIWLFRNDRPESPLDVSFRIQYEIRARRLHIYLADTPHSFCLGEIEVEEGRKLRLKQDEEETIELLNYILHSLGNKKYNTTNEEDTKRIEHYQDVIEQIKRTSARIERLYIRHEEDTRHSGW